MQIDDALRVLDQLRGALVAAKDADARVAAAGDRVAQLEVKHDALNKHIAARHETLRDLDAVIATRQAEAAAARRTLDDLREQLAMTETRLVRARAQAAQQLVQQLG